MGNPPWVANTACTRPWAVSSATIVEPDGRPGTEILVQDAPVAFLDQPLAWNLVQPYVQGATYTSLDDWPGDLFAADLSIADR